MFSLYGEQLAILQGGLQSIPGVLRMHVGLDDLFIVHNHHTVADGLQEKAQVKRILFNPGSLPTMNSVQ